MKTPLVPDPCSDLARTIEDHTGNLMREKGFKQIAQKSTLDERCMILLESKVFKIKIIKGPDEVNILIGRLSAPDIWGEMVGDETHWYYLRSLARFLSDDTSVHLPTPEEWVGRSLDVQVLEQSQLLQKYFDQIEALFGKGGFQTRLVEYEEFTRSRRLELRRKYKELSKKHN